MGNTGIIALIYNNMNPGKYQTVEISQTILLLDETTNHQSLSLAEDNYSYIIKLITK